MQDDCALVVLIYSAARLASTAKAVRTLASKSGAKLIVIVINGETVSEASAHQAFSDGRCNLEIVRHNNRGQEFGGYQAGVDRLKATELPAHIIVVNDTVDEHDILTRSYASHFVSQLLMRDDGAACGGIDHSERLLSVNGLTGSRWIRTHLFGMDRAALRAINFRIHVQELDPLINASHDPDAFFSNVPDRATREHLEHWLFVQGPYSWRRAMPLDARNCDSMANKARAILQEKYLTMRLERAGVAIRQVVLNRRALALHLAEKKLRGSMRT